MVYRALALIILGLVSSSSLGAACCGGGTGSSALIFSDHRARLLSSYENIAYIYDVDSNAQSTKRTVNEQEVVEKLNLAFSYQADNFFQYAISTSVNKVTRRSQSIEESSTLLGDTALTIGHEFLPEKFYSKWKPRGFVYNSLSLPTGNSKYETKKTVQTDVSGSGLYTNKIGVSFFKISGSLDILLDSSISLYLSKEIDSKEVSRKPSLQSQISFGYSPGLGHLRVGAGLSYLYDGPITVNSIKTPSSKIKGATVSASYMLGEDTGTVVYKDDTLFTGNKNTTLGRSFLLSYSKTIPY